MNIKSPVPWLVILTISASQAIYAHNAGADMEKREVTRQQSQQKADQESWDDFMNAVKEQETQANTDKESSRNKPAGQ